MNKPVAKRRRSLDDTITDAIAAGAFTQQEFAAACEEAARELQAETAAYAVPPATPDQPKQAA